MTLSDRTNFSKEDIGGEILPILTRGLYRDTLDSLREYIQNSIDADATEIEVSIDPDLVSISDNGTGMDGMQARRAIRLGVSDKNPLENIGFRGIGIYSSFNLCDSLEIFTKCAKEQTTYRLFFNFSRIRSQLLREQERRSSGLAPELNLEELLSDSVYMDSLDDGPFEDHGTMVILEGLLPDVYYRINSWDQVEAYLQNSVPLPFNPEFRYQKELTNKFEERDYRVVPLTLQMGTRKQSLYRPYTNGIFQFGGIHPPKYFDLKEGRHNFGFAWVCINDARATIKDLDIRGLLVKKYGFSIGDRRFLEPYFGRTVFSRRITGEIIVQHDGLIPNAGRSDFEGGSVLQRFQEYLPKFTRTVDTWANTIQVNDRAREVLSEAAIELDDINNRLPSVQRDRELLVALNVTLSEIDRRLKPHRRRLATLDPEGFQKCQDLLSGSQQFVRQALVAQRASTSKLEQEVVRAVQRETLTPTSVEQKRKENIPADLVGLLETYGLLESESLRQFLRFLDDNVLRSNLAGDIYAKAIVELRDHLEETL